jgi:hypothetical protein
MILLPLPLRARLVANRTRADLAGHDPAPVAKLFNPLGPAIWLATELSGDGDTLFGLADLGFGCPELGYFSLSEIAAIRLPFGLAIERDIAFASDIPLSRWTALAQAAGSIAEAERILGRTAKLPPG